MTTAPAARPPAAPHTRPAAPLAIGLTLSACGPRPEPRRRNSPTSATPPRQRRHDARAALPVARHRVLDVRPARAGDRPAASGRLAGHGGPRRAPAHDARRLRPRGPHARAPGTALPTAPGRADDDRADARRLSLDEPPSPRTRPLAPRTRWRLRLASASGTASGQIVYVNYGLPPDYEQLKGLGISVKDRIVIARYGRSHRAVKTHTAEQAGARALILYSDPADDGFVKGPAWPEGYWRGERMLQRGNASTLVLAR